MSEFRHAAPPLPLAGGVGGGPVEHTRPPLTPPASGRGTWLVLVSAFALLLAAVPAIPALAHHSFAMFDQRRIMTLEGTVTEFQWTNPHAFIEIDVPAAGGATQHWSIELNSPNNLKRQGWTRTALKAGDRVTLRMNPLRDGHHGGLFLDVRLPNGRVLDSGLPKNGTPVNVPQV